MKSLFNDDVLFVALAEPSQFVFVHLRFYCRAVVRQTQALSGSARVAIRPASLVSAMRAGEETKLSSTARALSTKTSNAEGKNNLVEDADSKVLASITWYAPSSDRNTHFFLFS